MRASAAVVVVVQVSILLQNGLEDPASASKPQATAAWSWQDKRAELAAAQRTNIAIAPQVWALVRCCMSAALWPGEPFR